MYLLRTLIFFLCTCQFAGGVVAQTPGFWHLTDAEGLPSNTIYHITESKQGYIYLGTAAGVTRFNGFKFFSMDNPEAKAADASNLYTDNDGNIWFSNFNHELFKMNKEGFIEKIKNIDQTNFNAQGKFLVDKKGNIWFFNTDKLYHLIAKTGKIKSWTLAQTPFSFQLYGDSALVAGFSALNLLQFEDNYPEFKQKDFILLNPNIKKEKPILYINKNKKFITSSNFSFLKSKEDILILDLNKFEQIKSVLNYGFLPNNTIWVATTDGFLLFDFKGNPLWNGNLIMKGKNVSYVYQDSRNNVWVATLDEGLYMINNFEIETRQFFTDNHRPNGVSYLFADKDEMLLGMQNGNIYRCDKSGEITKQQANIFRSIYYITKLNKQEGYILNFEYFKSLNGSGKEITELSAPRGMVLTESGLIYSNNSGLRRLSKAFLTDKKYELDPIQLKVENRNEKNEILGTSLMTVTSQILFGRGGKLFQDHLGQIWVNSSSGIYCLDIEHKLLKHIILSYNSNAMALDFAEDENGYLYMAIANDGIIKWGEKGIEKRYGIADGMLSSNARRLLWASGKLWIASAKGLNAFDPVKEKFYDYQISDGLVSNDMQDIAYFNNKIWVATFNGLSSIPVNFISENRNAPIINLISVLVNGKLVPTNLGVLNKLNYNENSIEFRFEGINYKSRNLLYYSYRLIGQSEKWTRLDGTSGVVLFQGLAAGKYVFEVKAFNDKNVSGNYVLRVPFYITEPVWKKSWFWLLIGLAGAGSVFYVLRKRQSDKIKKDKLENELRISQLASLKAQMNPHFMFNALNSIQDFILLNDKTSANTFLGKFSDLMRLVLDMSNQSHISLSNELKAINLYLELEALRFEDSMEYTVKISEDLDLTDWKIPSMIIQPFVENAIKHGLLHKRNKRKLHIEFGRGEAPDLLKVIISDNGIGRKEAERINNSKGSRHTSFATGATQKRLSLLNQNKRENIKIIYEDKMDENNMPAGTKVILTIPMISVNQDTNETI